MPASAPPRRGIGGLVGLLAVLAFVILAAVILTRRTPGESPVVPPTTTAAVPTTTLAPAPSEAPPSQAPASTEPAADVAPAPTAAEPAPVAPPPAGGKTPRSPRRAGTRPGSEPSRTADSGPLPRGGTALPPSGTSPRRFVLGTTSIESLKPVQRDLKGFEADNVGVKRAPEVNGRVELEMDPPAVRPGVDYTVKVFFANDGGKDIAVDEVKVSTLENGKPGSRAIAPRARLVKPRQRVLLAEISGVWREVVRTWAMDVVVTSGRQDVYRNGLRWE